MERIFFALLFGSILVWLPVGCQRPETSRATTTAQLPARAGSVTNLNPPRADCCEQVLAALPADSAVDVQIGRAQEAVRLGVSSNLALERLGWLYVTKARETFDDRFYKLAEAAADCLEARVPREPGAMLLRGHALHNQHRFLETERIARQLVEMRDSPFDHGLLGDALMELGRLESAAAAYQKMMDMRPDSRALARAAHLRWLRGDLPGAIMAMNEAARSAGSRDTETAAWMMTRAGFYQFAAGDLDGAQSSFSAALRLRNDYPPALFLAGRIHLAREEHDSAVDRLRRAVALHPAPEYLWAFSEALFEAGHFEEARSAAGRLRLTGAEGDGRSFALYLATRREQLELALSLARHELTRRQDVFTHDALAWCLASSGDFQQASVHMELALREGTVDGRFYFHAAVIAGKTGRTQDAARFTRLASDFAHQLLPSELVQLRTVASQRTPVSMNGTLPDENRRFAIRPLLQSERLRE